MALESLNCGNFQEIIKERGDGRKFKMVFGMVQPQERPKMQIGIRLVAVNKDRNRVLLLMEPKPLRLIQLSLQLRLVVTYCTRLLAIMMRDL